MGFCHAFSVLLKRCFSGCLEPERISRLRNIGISAHIDSGKTTLTERILYYTGRIESIHEVRGRDGVGAKMDSMELEREKGITIQSAATYVRWKDTNINIIDTPGHVDFTIEVERSLRVLDGAVLVVCAASGVQSQTITVDRQMRRYQVPRLIFINKLDRLGANPAAAIEQLRNRLRLNAVAIQIPVGLEDGLMGIIDVVERRFVSFSGVNGDTVSTSQLPEEYSEKAEQQRRELIDALAMCDDEVLQCVADDRPLTAELLHSAIRRTTIARSFVPVLMGAAFKNIGVQLLLDAVDRYLPNPSEVENLAIDIAAEKQVLLIPAENHPFVGLAFKLDDGKFGQLTYLRIYQGALSRGSQIYNTRLDRRVKVPRLVRMHANEMEDVEHLGAGEICALFGVECASGDTFTDGTVKISLTPIHVPEPVISLAIAPKQAENPNFLRAITKFTREDPTFRYHYDEETKQAIISGMGELHLEVYLERMKREFRCECISGRPIVAYKETITRRQEFDYLHKKQSGGAGQFGRVVGYIEPIASNSLDGSVSTFSNEFLSRVVGATIPTCYIPSVEKGVTEAMLEGPLTGNNVVNVRYVLTEGQAHVVDSSDFAFRQAAIGSVRKALPEAKAVVLEPIMRVEVSLPAESQGTVMASLTKRRGVVHDSEVGEEVTVVTADVPLNQMFGYSTELRSLTQGKGEFTMEYQRHAPVTIAEQQQLTADYAAKRFAKAAS